MTSAINDLPVVSFQYDPAPPVREHTAISLFAPKLLARLNAMGNISHRALHPVPHRILERSNIGW